MDSQIEITVRLGWDAEVLSHEGREYLPDKEGCFVLPQGVYFDLRTRGLPMEYLSEAEVKPPKKKAPKPPAEGGDTDPVTLPSVDGGDDSTEDDDEETSDPTEGEGEDPAPVTLFGFNMEPPK